MKKLIWGTMIIASLIACQDSESNSNELTGNETVYALAAGSEYDINGTVTFKEKKDGTTLIDVALTGTEGEIEHPVHIHLGNITEPGADVYAQLNPVLGKTGASETLLTQIADETTITYQQLVGLNACIKIHLAASGPDRDIILAGGNIGTAAASSSGRQTFGVCKSE